PAGIEYPIAHRLRRRGTALGTEYGARRKLGSAVAAELLRSSGGGGQCGTAVLAELAARLLVARRAAGRPLVSVVDTHRQVHLLDLLVELIDLCGCLHSGDFLAELGRAARTQPTLVVPAHGPAHPLATPVALLEMRLHLVRGLGKRLVPGRAAASVA